MIARRHWFAALAMLIPVSILFLVPFVVLAVIGFSGGLLEFEVWHWDAVIAGCGVFLLFAGFVFMVAWMSFYYDFQIVTDRRIVEIDQHRLFSREISELTYDTIEDIKVSVKGFFGTYLNFGDIEIQTAAEYRNFVLEKVPFPHKIAKVIADINSQCNQGIPPDEREPRGSVVGFINGQDVLRVGHKFAVMNYERNLGETGEEEVSFEEPEFSDKEVIGKIGEEKIAEPEPQAPEVVQTSETVSSPESINSLSSASATEVVESPTEHQIEPAAPEETSEQPKQQEVKEEPWQKNKGFVELPPKE